MAARDRDVRAGDADRDEVINLLGDAFAEGRLDYEELHHRQELAARARTMGDLRPLVRDLPTGRGRGEDDLVLVAGLRSQRRAGPWSVPPRLVLGAAVADVRVDFRHALCAHRVVEVWVRPGLGRVVLVVPRSWGVRVEELRTGWGVVRNDHRPEPEGDHPVLVVRGSLGVGRLLVRRPRWFGL